jgi:hypothetical protein
VVRGKVARWKGSKVGSKRSTGRYGRWARSSAYKYSSIACTVSYLLAVSAQPVGLDEASHHLLLGQAPAVTVKVTKPTLAVAHNVGDRGGRRAA